MLRLLALFSALVLTFNPANGYGGGAPNGKNVCATLTPEHGSKQNGEAPYRLIVNDVEGQIQIGLKATAQVTFAGFIVQAKDADNRQMIVDGQFARHENSQPKTCATGKDNTWTHTNGQPKTEVETVWQPPMMFNGSVVFQGTVVQVKQAYWPEIFSEPIFFLAGEIVDQQTYQEYLKDKREESSPSSAASQLGNGLGYEKCSNHVCIGLGEISGCLPAKNCDMLLAAKQTSGENRFQITAKPETAKSRYFSAAFSDDTKMGGDVVVDCIVDSRGTVKMGVSVNNGKTNKLSDAARNVLKNVHVANVDGVVSCEWTMDNNFQVESHQISLVDKKYYLLLAMGDTENDVGAKGYHDIRVPSSEPVNLVAAGSVAYAEVKDLSYLIKIHGGLMILAWIGTVSIGIMFARYFKDSWPDTLLHGVKVWFAFHRPLMIFSILCMCIAQACIVYYVGGYVADRHQIAGGIAFLCALLQPIGAMFRPHPEASTRWIFNWGHWFGGNLGQIMAIVAILLATNLKNAGLPPPFFYVVLVWIVFHVFSHLTLMLHSACASRSKTGDIALHELQNGQQIYIESSGKGSGQGFRTFMLFIYSLVTATFCALLIALVVMPDTIMEFF